MQFILEYVHHIANTVCEKIICLEAESVESVQQALDEKIMHAITHNRPRFEFGGQSLALHDFVRRVSQTKWDYASRQASLYNKKMPRAVVTPRGDLYAFEKYTLLPAHEWFIAKAQPLPPASPDS